MRSLFCIVLAGGSLVLLGCPKSESAATSTDSAAASSAPAASVSQATLAPLDTPTASATATTTTTAVATVTAGGVSSTSIVHTDAAAKPVTSATPSAQAQFKQCCAALHKQSQTQTPQAAQLAQAAGICDGLAASMATAPAMPQLDQVKMLLAGVQLPPVCQGL